MRRFLTALSALCLLFCAGCAGAGTVKAEDLVFQFSCRAEIQCPEGTYTCSFQREGTQDASLTFLSGGPEGLGFHWSGDGFSLTYQGLADSGGDCVLAENSFARVLVETLDCAEKKGALIPVHGNEYSGSCGGMDFLLTADPETDFPKTLLVPDKKIQADFYDFDQKTISAFTEDK